MAAVETLTDANLEAVRQSDQLEGHLMDEMEDRETDITPWGILQRLSPLLFNWVSNQLSLLHRCGAICGRWSAAGVGLADWDQMGTCQMGTCQ